MAEKIITSFLSTNDIDQIHFRMDNGYRNLTDKDILIIDRLFDLVSTAIHFQTRLNFITTMDENISKTLSRICISEQ